MTDGPIMDAVDRYPDTEAYIEGEYAGEIPIIKAIIERHAIKSNTRVTFDGDYVTEYQFNPDALAMDIVGYYTGCLRPDGTPRVSRRRREPSS